MRARNNDGQALAFRIGSRARCRQRGASLPFALIAVMLGTLLLTPVLSFLSSRHLQVHEYEQVLGARYADDAAIEYAIWRLGEDVAFRDLLLVNRGVPQPLTVPAPVNGVTATVEIVLVNPMPWPWAMWASYLVHIVGNNTTIYGGVHSNGAVTIDGNNTVIHGTVEQYQPEPSPVTWDIAAFRPGGAEALRASSEGMYHYHGGNWTPSRTEDMPSGLHYVVGNVVIDDNRLVGTNVTIVAEGTIEFKKNKDYIVSPYVDGLVFFSNSNATPWAIQIDGNKFMSEGGVCYAPRGVIDLAGNKTQFVGAFVAHTIIVSKNTLITELPFDMMVPETCSIYDIRSTARERETVARVRYCLDNPPLVDAWAVQ